MDGLELGMSVPIRHALEKHWIKQVGNVVKGGATLLLSFITSSYFLLPFTCYLAVCSGIRF